MIFEFLGTFLIRSIGYFVQGYFFYFWENTQNLQKFGPGGAEIFVTDIVKWFECIIDTMPPCFMAIIYCNIEI